jgi:hypothetical protein
VTFEDSLHCEKLRAAFEGGQAIYVEKGLLHVRVKNIVCSPSAQTIDAVVEEIPTPGLEYTHFHDLRREKSSPLQWSIGAGYLTTYSNSTWEMGYGGWSLYFAPEAVAGLINIASDWTRELSSDDRYDEALRFLEGRNSCEQPQRVFSD